MKYKYLTLMILVSALFFTSCNISDDNHPVYEIEKSKAQIHEYNTHHNIATAIVTVKTKGKVFTSGYIVFHYNQKDTVRTESLLFGYSEKNDITIAEFRGSWYVPKEYTEADYTVDFVKNSR